MSGTPPRRRLDLGMWVQVPGKPHLARLYCEGCERFSRPVRVRVPTEPTAPVMYPDPPKGWGHGCPRCDR